MATRPVQEMSNTASAIRAAKEVKADTLAPELFRISREWFYRSRKEYRLKNFKEAKIYSTQARIFAEKAEFQAIQNGGKRNASDAIEEDPFDDTPDEPPIKTNTQGLPDSVTYESAIENRKEAANAKRARQQGARPSLSQ